MTVTSRNRLIIKETRKKKNVYVDGAAVFWCCLERPNCHIDHHRSGRACSFCRGIWTVDFYLASACYLSYSSFYSENVLPINRHFTDISDLNNGFTLSYRGKLGINLISVQFITGHPGTIHPCKCRRNKRLRISVPLPPLVLDSCGAAEGLLLHNSNH